MFGWDMLLTAAGIDARAFGKVMVRYAEWIAPFYAAVAKCKSPGFVMAVGNHIPANTPVDNALWYNECYEKLSRR